MALAGCLGGTGVSLDAPRLGRAAPDTVKVAGGDIVVGGPAGYCVDRRGSRLFGAPAFVLLASCASISGEAADAAPNAPGLLTASVDQRTDNVPSATEFRDVLTSETGRATLARDGRASSVTILERDILDGALILKLRDTSANPTPGLEAAYWRGLFALNGRLITVTVNGFDVRPMGTDTGRAKLIGFIRRIQAESPALSGVETAATP